MNALLTIFALMQAAGSIIGAGGSVVAELWYLRAIQDGRIDEAERTHLKAVAGALRWGMLLLLVGSIGLVITNFAYLTPVQPALTPAYWGQMFLIAAILFASWLTARRLIGFTVGTAAIFSGWWLVAFLSFGRLPPMSFGALVALYLVASAIIAAGLWYARMMITRRA